MVEHLTDLWNGCIIINKTESVKKILKKIFPHISANVNNLGDFNPTLFRGKCMDIQRSSSEQFGCLDRIAMSFSSRLLTPK